MVNIEKIRTNRSFVRVFSPLQSVLYANFIYFSASSNPGKLKDYSAQGIWTKWIHQIYIKKSWLYTYWVLGVPPFQGFLKRNWNISSDSNGIRTKQPISRKRTLNHLAKLACGLEFWCCHLSFRYRACFESGVPWHSGN